MQNNYRKSRIGTVWFESLEQSRAGTFELEHICRKRRLTVSISKPVLGNTLGTMGWTIMLALTGNAFSLASSCRLRYSFMTLSRSSFSLASFALCRIKSYIINIDWKRKLIVHGATGLFVSLTSLDLQHVNSQPTSMFRTDEILRQYSRWIFILSVVAVATTRNESYETQ